MESNFNNRDFERFLKQSADQYRMFPSEKVWKGVHNALHTRRRWYGIGFTLLLLTIGAVTWVMVSSTGKGQLNQSTPPSVASLDQKATFAVQSDNKTFSIPGTENWQKDQTTSNLKNHLENEPGVVLSKEPEKITNEAVIKNKPILRLITESFSPFIKKQTVFTIPPVYFNPIIAVIDDNPELDDLSNNNLVVENKITGETDIYPLTIESVVNSFKYNRRKNITWEVYLAPTISYRRLAENKSFVSSPSASGSPFNYIGLYDVNSAVTHKPDMGFELGFNAGYAINSYLKIIGGLQFNVSKYDIRAYDTYPTELATVALTNNSGTRASRSVSTPTNYRNFGGYSTNWLHNLYLSASLPIGAELRLKGDNKTYLGIGGTIQPTYILGDRAYMISTDYKNYVEMPQLIRRLNVSTSLESFIGYNTGKINWKVGPQVRYQLFSSFQKKYPVKEHIFDFGLKVGIMLNK